MTVDTPSPTGSAPQPVADGPDERFARLAGALALVARLSGDAQAAPPVPADAAADYAMAGPIARRRFDALATETAAFAAAGIEILLRQRSTRGGDCRAAAAQLAAEMRTAMTAMMQVIERRP
ncbi:hypothetical protein [Sphingomonas sp. KC8]|uniref:hypothetical protein n=1 Tax=Sphingomonas sp. KC8 TaxID=1030157 RepID=UPI000248A38D|nr:hypothetical protein [Sphingomonas sp. KC8]ARS28006.1 hypothetical protein KC8_12005 [Sphingomonas sp. KC8]